MRQKPGIRPTTPTVEAPGTSTQRPRTPDGSTDDPVFGPANRFWPEGSTVSSAPVKPAQDPALDNTALKLPIVVATGIPAPATSHHDVRTPLLEPYVQQVSSKLPAPDENGLRIFKNRRFVDVEVVDGVGNSTQTVMVEFDTRLNTYRAKSPQEQGAFGPPLYRSVTGDVWSLNKPTTYFDSNRYTVSHLPDAQGYYAVSYGGSPFQAPESGFAFRDEQHRWVRVDPAQARGDASVPVNLAQWTDGDIWKLYRIHGPEILLFRAEVQQTGKVPLWVRRFAEPATHLYLTDSLKWVYPQHSFAERAKLLRSYNLSENQQARLRQELASGQMPEWAEQHKLLTQNKDDDQRFKLVAEELEPYILKLRNEGDDYGRQHKLRDRFTEEFFDEFLQHAGYQRNLHGALYRTDIPSMFRGDHRTPMELARDRRMIHLKGNATGSTTKRGFSVTFSLGNAIGYKKHLGGYEHPLKYNSQANLYPARNSDSDSTVTEGNRDGSESDSDSSFVFDDSKDYPALRRNQHLGFIYVIDTRGIEVVPGWENIELNRTGIHFDPDALEGRISMPTRGISAERIWLVNSELTRAARVDDIYTQAGADADAIEKATWAGDNQAVSYRKEVVPGDGTFFVPVTRYDQLIDEVAASGKPVLELPRDVEVFANDIVWPVPEHYRT
ncbi:MULTISPECIES: hypothetical protein [unclassified Pseudomonas]|uniref:hypothetical protein n=1 Tax=Pseudomonas sp. A-R-26 TaxID=2832404 RepID=UPI001CBB4F68|nr:hypothetical protein [Pseudomonas sp. A-R-26]